MGPPPSSLTRQREAMAWELHAKGTLERLIADALDAAGLGRVTQQAVSLMIKRVEKRSFKEMAARVEGVKARQTTALWFMHNEALAAWEKSKEPKKTATQKVITGTHGANPTGSEEKSTHIADTDGDPRFLDLARSIMADIRKIWGADAAKQMELAGSGGGPIQAQIIRVIRPPDAKPLGVNGFLERNGIHGTNGHASK